MTRFVLPPMPRLEASVSAAGRGAADGAARLGAWIDAVAGHWLGTAIPPAERAIADAGWIRDGPTLYCRCCGDSVGPGESGGDGCASCRAPRRARPSIPWDVFVRLGTYAGPLREWILDVKHRRRWTEMAEALGARLGEAVLADGELETDRIVVVAMPMPWARRLYRGIDHAHVIGWAAARRMGAPLVPVLARSNGPPQASLPRSARVRAGRQGLRVARRLGGWRLDGLHVVLVDDVATTGASLRAAARLIRGLGPDRIAAAVLAVSDHRARRQRSQGEVGSGNRSG